MNRPDRVNSLTNQLLIELRSGLGSHVAEDHGAQVYRALNQPLGEAIRETNRLMQESLKPRDFKAGVPSFTEKRPTKLSRVES